MKIQPAVSRAIRALARSLREVGEQHMVIGGIAVVARGIPRVTRDVDVAVRGGADCSRIIRIMARHGVVPRIKDAERFAAKSLVLLLQHRATGVDVDLSFAFMPFEDRALAEAERMRIASTTIPIARPDALIVYKAIAMRAQDQQDILGLLNLYGPRLDLQAIKAEVRELAAALDDPDRADRFEALIAQAKKRRR